MMGKLKKITEDDGTKLLLIRKKGESTEDFEERLRVEQERLDALNVSNSKLGHEHVEVLHDDKGLVLEHHEHLDDIANKKDPNQTEFDLGL